MPAHRRAFLFRAGVHSFAAALVSAAVLAAFASVASAAGDPVQAATTCRGFLKQTPTMDEPNNLTYNFDCTRQITGYTLVVDRTPTDLTTVDDFSTTADVVDGTGAIAPSESFGCEGAIPGAGVNCNGTMSAVNFAIGSFDMSDPYCPSIPAGSPPGTAPTAQATVKLVVSDSTGAENGPFRINLNRFCPIVKATPLPKHKHKSKCRHTHGKKICVKKGRK